MSLVVNLRNSRTVVNSLEIASNMRTRLVGLIGKSEFLPGHGLLIKRSGNSIHTFFMKFSIDLAFVDKKGKVRHTASDVKPWRFVIAPLFTPTDCLELPAGTLRATDTKQGDVLRVET